MNRLLKEDLTGYSDNELSFRVFNEESFYRIRKDDGFIDYLAEIYAYTAKQLEVLEADLEEDNER